MRHFGGGGDKGGDAGARVARAALRFSNIFGKQALVAAAAFALNVAVAA